MIFQNDLEEWDDISLLIFLNLLNLDGFRVRKSFDWPSGRNNTKKIEIKSSLKIACRWKKSELIYKLKMCIFNRHDIEL